MVSRNWPGSRQAWVSDSGSALIRFHVQKFQENSSSSSQNMKARMKSFCLECHEEQVWWNRLRTFSGARGWQGRVSIATS